MVGSVVTAIVAAFGAYVIGFSRGRRHGRETTFRNGNSRCDNSVPPSSSDTTGGADV